jgi:hypothetical protein
VETLEVLVRPKEERAAIAVVGTWKSNGVPGTTDLLVDKSTAQVLIRQLQQFGQQTAEIYIREARKRVMVDNAFARVDDYRNRKSVSVPGLKSSDETKSGKGRGKSKPK